MTIQLLIAAALAALVYSLLSRRLAGWPVTGPMIFLLLGWALSHRSGFDPHAAEPTLDVLAEVTLVIVLFADAAMIDGAQVRRLHIWPARMLVIGLPLAMLIGVLPGMALLSGWSIWEIALIAAILAPTDAALGQAVVTNAAVPGRVQRALVVESGLNDGFALPVVLMLGCIAVGGQHDFAQSNWAVFAGQQIGFGLLAGALIGGLGGLALGWARKAGLSLAPLEGVAVLAVAGLCFLGAHALGGNGFLSAFVGGMAYRATLGSPPEYLMEFMETEGALLVMATFLLAGIVLVPEALEHASLAHVALVLVSLLAVRPLAIWLSLGRTDAPASARLFMGWFGPRGLATLLFALMIVGDLPALNHGEEILMIATLAVFVSTVLHGISAAPFARWFGAELLGKRTGQGQFEGQKE
ncbi:MAG: cation:proton antiporter [Pseudomonadota bacterium]